MKWNFLPFFCYITSVFAFQEPWTVQSWRQKTAKQMPSYKNQTLLHEVERSLQQKAPLIFSNECELLKRDLALAAQGKAFIIMGGDCAESFSHFHADYVRDLYKLLLQLGILQTFLTGTKTIKIARAAGQFTKPRSAELESQGNKSLPVFRGDMVNEHVFEQHAREPDPLRMLRAYHQSAETLNLLRAFSSGGFASLSQIQRWNAKFFRSDKKLINSRYIVEIDRALKFLNGLGISSSHPILSQTNVYTGHECLQLPYEEALTRKDSFTKKFYDCSGHFLWIGDRTRFLDSAHVEFCRGLHNPIGIKVSAETNVEELLQILNRIDPTLEYGKIVLMTRFGAKSIRKDLPPLLRAVKRNFHHVVWCCDPMHGNTVTQNGVKTRYVEDIEEEMNAFHEILTAHNVVPAGVHLEMTPEAVTECIYKNESEATFTNYQSLCDPRLNAEQSLRLMIKYFEGNLKSESFF